MKKANYFDFSFSVFLKLVVCKNEWFLKLTFIVRTST